MKRLLKLVVVTWACACACAWAAATTYYVSSSTGNDNNEGTQAAPWRTLASVSSGGANAWRIVPGTTVLLARGDVWQEPLVPGSSGTSGSPIVFDAYGTGPAPEITGSLSLAAANWTQVSGYTNQWSAPVTATGMNYVLFGTIWGTRQASQAAVQHDRDFSFNGSLLYVYAPSNPTTYYGSVSAMLMTGAPLVSVIGKQWLTFRPRCN